jgi:hypothetical protein
MNASDRGVDSHFALWPGMIVGGGDMGRGRGALIALAAHIDGAGLQRPCHRDNQERLTRDRSFRAGGPF